MADAPTSDADDAGEAEMDLMLDPTRKPLRSNDPGWKYGYWTYPPVREVVTCNLCKRKLTGGITRLKEHLAGAYVILWYNMVAHSC